MSFWLDRGSHHWPKGRRYRVLVAVYHEHNGVKVWVQPGFVFDGPTFLPVSGPNDPMLFASAFHDALTYERQRDKVLIQPARSFSRRDADRFFLDVMKERGISLPWRLIVYLAVRLFGWMR